MTIFRFLKDNEFGPVRGMAAGMTPATTRLFSSMKDGDRARNNKLPPKAVTFLKSINSKPAYQYLIQKGGGWSNGAPFPTVEQLTFQNNMFVGERVDDIWTAVYTLKFTDIFLPNLSFLRGHDTVPMKYFRQWWWNIKRDGSLLPGKNYANQSEMLLISAAGVLFVPSYKVVAV